MSKPVKRRFKLTTISLSPKDKVALIELRKMFDVPSITQTVRTLIREELKRRNGKG